jgi:SAM-dependent methyltransferase
VPGRPPALDRAARSLLKRLPFRARLALLSAYRRQALPRWGNLRRTRPFSETWGFERGTPVDRMYMERFLERHAGDVRGEALEVMNADYLHRYGGSRITRAHVVDIDPDNPLATIVADLSEPGSLPADSFDVVVLTQTLQLVPDVRAALENVWTSMRPGGVLLVSVPTITPVDRTSRGFDRWRFTVDGLRTVISQACPGAEIDAEAFGNASAGVAFLMGITMEEMKTRQVETFDPDVAILACARVRKPSTGAGDGAAHGGVDESSSAGS